MCVGLENLWMLLWLSSDKQTNIWNSKYFSPKWPGKVFFTYKSPLLGSVHKKAGTN